MKTFKKLLVLLATSFLLTGCDVSNNKSEVKESTSESGSGGSGSESSSGSGSSSSESGSSDSGSSGSGSSDTGSSSSDTGSSESSGGGGNSGDYYASITDNLTGGTNGTFATKLGALVRPAKNGGSLAVPAYSGDAGDYCLSKVLQECDEDQSNKNNMIFFYTRESKTKGLAQGDKYWNREHVWPQSLSNGCWGKAGAGTDMLHLRPTYKDTNNYRGNQLYGKVSGSYVKYNGYEYGKKAGDYFEPTDAVKGDCARIIMYVWTAYKDYYSNLPDVTNVFESVELMLEWHLTFAPSALEYHRNDYAQSSPQKNRNPFVDHPEYACKIWGNTNSKTKQLCGM